MEAVSSDFESAVGDKDNEFKQLGYERNGNYQKLILLSDISIDKIVREMRIIFETIYNVKFQSYEIDVYAC